MKKGWIILMLLAFGLAFGIEGFAQKGNCNRSGQGQGGGKGSKSCMYGKQAGFTDANHDGICDHRKDGKSAGYGKGDGTCKKDGSGRRQGNYDDKGSRNKDVVVPQEKK
jgi:hypothetical protein